MVTLFQTLLFLLPFLFSFCAAQSQPPQPQHTFNWGFVDVSLTTFVAQCETISLKTIDFAGTDGSVPPYSVASFEVNGISDWQYNVSTNSANIPWTPRHDSNAQVLVTVVDGHGNIGGMAKIITVEQNANTSCLLPAHPNPPVISQVNVTTSLSTCDLWGMSVTGGTPPYGAFIVPTNNIFTPFNSTSSTNHLTYKNRTPPKQQMFVAIQDSKGVWGASTQVITTKGSTDTSCKGGVESSWIGDAQFEAGEIVWAAATARARKNQQITIALAVVFSLLGATILGLGLWYYFRYRRPTAQQFDRFDLPPPPPPYDPEKGSVGPAPPATVDLQASQSVRTVASAAPSDDRSSAISGPVDLGRTVSNMNDLGSRAHAASEQRLATYVIPDMSAVSMSNPSPPRRANSTSPFPQGRQPSRKALEAAEERRIARDRVPPAPSLSPDGSNPYESPSSYVGSSQRQLPTPHRQPTIGSSYSQALSRQPSAISSFQAGAPAVEEDEYEVDGTIVIQHRDAGTNRIVVELPPAYAPAVDAQEALDAKVALPAAGPSTVGPHAL